LKQARRLVLQPRHRPHLAIAEALKYGIVGINEGIILTEIALFGGVKESRIGPTGGSTRLEIRHRGIPRGQISVHGRHQPLGEPLTAQPRGII